MKKSRFILKTLLVMVLTVLLITAGVSYNTFSWFERPQSKTGGTMSLSVPYGDVDPNGNANSMKAYDGKNLSMATYVSTDDAISFSETAADPATSGSLAPTKRVYYNTTITNSGSTDQKVSLYLKDFKPGGESGAQICVGVNNPIKAFKNYSMYDQTVPSPTRGKKYNDTKRVYYTTSGASGSWAGTTFYVKSGNNVDSNVQSSVQMTRVTNTSSYYYADIPSGHNQLYLATAPVPSSDQRTQTFTNLNGDGLSQVKCLEFYTNGSKNDYNNYWAGKNTITAPTYASYYNNVSLSKGQTIDVSLAKGVDYDGSAISYSSSNTGVFTVSNAGVITGVAAGTATLTYTITAPNYKEIKLTATVVVQGYSTSSTTITNAPIVTNLTVSANSSVDVWWFIQNGDDSYVAATATGSYTHKGIFLSV